MLLYLLWIEQIDCFPRVKMLSLANFLEYWPRLYWLCFQRILWNINTANLKSRHYFDPPWIKVRRFYDKIIYIFIFINLFCKVWHKVDIKSSNIANLVTFENWWVFKIHKLHIDHTKGDALYGCFCGPK